MYQAALVKLCRAGQSRHTGQRCNVFAAAHDEFMPEADLRYALPNPRCLGVHLCAEKSDIAFPLPTPLLNLPGEINEKYLLPESCLSLDFYSAQLGAALI